ncbi:unnamed protein product [Phytophthora fragariaefolia]|uniref:Unnamed protein product n=1 Tax=Phytophthora fragariaefolia TaxID=1490495 RepID=A0A9W7CY32_9STRA|nr:unnamed protein product [Phytophthora fragariaefolia]
MKPTNSPQTSVSPAVPGPFSANMSSRRNSNIRHSLDGSGEWFKTLRDPISGIVPLELLSTPTFLRPRKGPNTVNNHHLTFWQAFGLLGVPMLLLLFISILWTAWLIIMTLAPNETANYLMNTSAYDDGQFWLLAEQDIGIKIARVFGFSLVEVGYFHILVKMLVWRTIPVSPAAIKGGIRNAKIENSRTEAESRRKNVSLSEFWEELTKINGSYRKFWVSCCLTVKGLSMSDSILMCIENRTSYTKLRT